MKKLISMLLAIVLATGVYTAIPFAVNAAEIKPGSNDSQSGTTGDCTWILDDNGTLTISGNGAMADYRDSGPWCNLSVPVKSVVFEKGVTYIGNDSFEDCKTLESVTFSDTITKIGDRAFQSCTALESIEIPGNIKSFGRFTFATNKGLKTVVIDNGVQGLGYGAFEGDRNLEKITIPASVTNIDMSTLGEDGNVTIYGYKGSDAERYADFWYIPFVDISEN